MAVYFSTNPEDWAATNGIYIAEQDQPTGASIVSTAGIVKIVGEFPWGPVDEVLEIGDPQVLIDTLVGKHDAPEDYKGYLAIVGKQWGTMRIVRISNDTQEIASRTLDDGADDAYTVTAKYPGVVGNDIETLHVDNGDSTFDLTITWGTYSKTYVNLSLTTSSLDDGIDDPYVDVAVDPAGGGVPSTDGAAVALSGGSDGSFGDSDYTGSAVDVRGLEVMKQAEDGGTVFAAEYTSASWISSLRTYIDDHRSFGVAMADSSDTFGDHVTAAEAIADDRLALCGHRVKQFVANTATKVDLSAWLASVLVNIPSHISPAAYRNRELLEGIIALADGVVMGRTQWIQAKNAGLMTLERLDNGGWKFHAGITSDTNEGKTLIATRRMKDLVATNSYLALIPFQNEPPLPVNVTGGKSALQKKLATLLGDEEVPDTQQIEAYSVTVIDVTPLQVIYKTKVALWGEMGSIVNSIVVGENVEIEEAA